MHALYEEQDCTESSEVFELNAMDFVETEYKSDEPEQSSAPKKARRKSQRKRKVPIQHEVCCAINLSSSQKSTKKKRTKGQSNSKSTYSCNANIDSKSYPYAMVLKDLSSKVGEYSSEDKPRTERLFKLLDPISWCYPYAMLLQELHDIAREDGGLLENKDSFVNPHERRLSQIMKSLKYKNSILLDNVEESRDEQLEDFDVPFCTLLLDIIKEHEIQSLPDSSMAGIGKILNRSMGNSHDKMPLREFRCSDLLQKLSFIAERDSIESDNSTVRYRVGGNPSGESSQEEEYGWRPTRRKSGNTLEDGENYKKKKKSLRKKIAATAECKTKGSRNKVSETFTCKSQPLLQVLFEEVSNACNGHKMWGKKPEDSKVRSEVLAKIKNKITASNQKDKEEVEELYVDDAQSPQALIINEDVFSETSEEEHSVESDPLELKGQTSLLKEYLLKPYRTSNLQCNLPTVSENGFLFSKLLQNFKNASDNQHSDNSLDACEETTGSILREMLIETCQPFPNNSKGNNKNDNEHFSALTDESSVQTDSSENKCFTNKNFFRAIKCEDEEEMCSNILKKMLVKNVSDTSSCTVREYENEIKGNLAINSSSTESSTFESDSLCEIKCEVKCEDEYVDDTHECSICHLQFLSEMDLSNHEILFHASDENSLPNHSPPCVLPHSNDILQNNFLQEKLPV